MDVNFILYLLLSNDLTPPTTNVTEEMSRYIDLEKYHRVERTHLFYEEMLAEILSQIKNHLNKNQTTILELGAGTGIFTLELAKIPTTKITAVEIDINCCDLLKKYLANSNVEVIQDDMITFQSKEKYDLLVSTFSHDHCSYEKRFEFAKNLNKNLKLNGFYIMGNELIPKFSNEEERKESLKTYHNFIINKAIDDGNNELAELEKESLHSGLNKIGDFKRYEEMLEEEMISSGFKIIKKEKMGPKNNDRVGGVFVYVFKKVQEL